MAGTYNTTMDRGSDWAKTFLWKDSTGTAVPLSGYTARMMIKVTESDSSAVATLTTTNGRIVLYPDGHIVLSLPGSQTERITPGSYMYDLKLSGPAHPYKTLLRGTITVIGDVTRP